MIPLLGDADDSVEWVLARDGSLTAMLPGERWWAGCSVPLAAARFMLRKMEAGGNVACFLSPFHAAQFRVALDRLEPQQAIIALLPDPLALRIVLHCDDFSREIGSHRLWFAAGENWESTLEQLFVERPGLPTPAQFIRPILSDPEPADRLISPAQKIFSAEGTRRTELVRRLIDTPREAKATRGLCVIAPSRFRLWDSAPDVLARIVETSDLEGIRITRFDPDDPAWASPVALASAIASCDAVIAANLARVDAPDVAPRELPWVTWVTTPRVPVREGSGPQDALLLADASGLGLARDGGWPTDRIEVAAWPAVTCGECPGNGPLALVADTQPLQPPKRVEDFSSHKLLWEMIADEMLNDPFAIGDDVEAYLARRMARLQIADTAFDRTVFVNQLIVPAFQQGLAHLMIREAIPLRLHGKGWDQIEALSPGACGPVSSSGDFEKIIRGAGGLVHAWPSRHVHPIDATGRPVVRAFGHQRDSFLRAIRNLRTNPPAPRQPAPGHTLGWDVIARLLAVRRPAQLSN